MRVEAPGIYISSTIALTKAFASARRPIYRIDTVAARGYENGVIVTHCHRMNLFINELGECIDTIARGLRMIAKPHATIGISSTLSKLHEIINLSRRLIR